MHNILKISFVIIGSFVGAGFASGQEILLFFNSYGVKGFFNIFLSFFIISLLIYKTLELIRINKISNYNQFLENLIGNNNKYINSFFSASINIFLLISFFIMLCGFSTCLTQEFNINIIISSIISSALCYFILLNNVNGIIKVNEFLIPFLIGFIIFIGFKQIDSFNINIVSCNTPSAILSGFIYASYNSIILVPMLVTLGKFINNKKTSFFISLLCGICLSILSAIIFLLLTGVDVNIQIPIIYAASNLGYFFKFFCIFIILIAILTSAISSGYSFLINVTKSKKMYLFIAFIICFFPILISQFSFSKLVEVLYPIFGYLGLFQIFLILKK